MNDFTTLKRCSTCGIEQPATREYFHRTSKNKDGLNRECRKCSSIRHTAYNRKKGHKPANLSQIVDGMRRCTKCYEWYSNTKEYFYSDAQKKDGISPVCKKCQYEQQKRWRRENPEKQKIKEARERANRSPERRIRDLESTRRYYWRNRDRKLVEMRKYYRDTIEYQKKRHRKYRQANRHRAREYERLNVRQPAQLAKRHRRMARQHDLPDTFTGKDLQYALDYFGYTCAVCGRPRGLWHTLALDHWIPLSSPDCPGTIPTNMIPLCHGLDGCNNIKRHRKGDEWLIERFGKRKAKPILERIQAYFDSLAEC